MARLSIRLLDSFQVRLDLAPITNFESDKVRALLAYLVMEASRAHSREKLAALFWPEMSAKRSLGNLSHALYNLRQVIGDHQEVLPYLLRSRKTVQFNTDSDYWLDVNAFIDGLEDIRISDRSPSNTSDDHLERLRTAVDLYRDDFLKDVVIDSSMEFDEWMLLVRQRLQRQVLKALRLLVGCYAGRGETDRALSYAWRQVELDPLDEPACRQLMRLLAISEQRSQALTQYERLRVLLAEELNIIPEAKTVELRDRIAGKASLPSQSEIRNHNLPALLMPLIDRQQELAELKKLCSNPDCRLLTILGPGGSGKTRLALEVARSSLNNYRHGVFFVLLNPLQSPASIPSAILGALGLPRQEGDNFQAQLTNYLRDKDLLLVLDGFEHLLAGAGWLVEILRQAPLLKVLVTSRTRLNAKGEQLYPLTEMRYQLEAASEAEVLQADAVTGSTRSRAARTLSS